MPSDFYGGEIPFQAIAESANDVIVVIDTDSRIQFVNQRVTDVFGYAPDKLVDKSLTQLMPSRYQESHTQGVEQYLSTGERTLDWSGIELPGLHNDGTEIPLRISFSEFTQDSERYFVGVIREITEQKERERQLETYKSLFENTNDCIVETTFVDGEPIIKSVNAAFEEVFGYDKTEIIGQNLDDLIVPKTLDDEAREITTTAEEGETFTREVVRTTVDGPREFLLRPVHTDDDRSYAIYTDITEQKKRERELERTERRFDAVFNAPSALVTFLDREGRIEEISDAAVDLVAESRDEIRGRFLWEGPWFEGDETIQRQWRETVEQALNGESTRVETSVPLPDRELVVDAMFEPVTDTEGRLTGVVGIARDITTRHQDQRIRRQLLLETRDMMAAESREQLAQTVSDAVSSVLDHEFNAVYLNEDDENELLTPVAWSNRVDESLDGPLSVTDESPLIEAYQCSDPVIYDDLNEAIDRSADQFAPVESLIALPIDDHGVLGVGATEPSGFTEADIDRYRLLTVSAAAAFDRLTRTRELQRYETLFETVQEKVYVLDEDGAFELVSESLAESVGYDSDTLEGQHASTVVSDDTASEIEHRTLDLLMTPESVSNTCEGTIVARDGTKIPVEIELSVLPHEANFQGTAGVVRDISERRQREEELQVFRTAITKAGIGLVMYGADGQFEYINDHYADMLGQRRDTLVGTRIWETAEDISSETFDTYWKSFETNETRIDESQHRRRDGSTVPVESVTTAVDVGETRYHIATIQDITDRRERRQQTEALHRILRHNLRNDLTVLRGYADVLSEELTSDHRPMTEKILETTEELIDLTETAAEARDLLNRDTARRPVDITELVREQVHDVRTQFEVDVDLDLPETAYVLADTTFSIALDQVLTNAVEHNDSSHSRVWVRIVSMDQRDDWITVEIADNGPGIPDIETEALTTGEEEQLKHGIGLGLWIVHWIVSRYGGDLSFEDRDPTGSRVRIALPKADATPAAVSETTDDDPPE